METLIIIAKSAAILSLFYLTYLLVLQKDTFFSANRHFLIGGIIAALTLPFIEFTQTSFIDMPIYEAMPVTTSFGPMTQEMTPVAPSFTMNWWLVALITYLVGVGIMLTRLGIQLASLQRLIQRHPKTKQGRYTFIEVYDDIAPFSFFQTIVYNPKIHTVTELEMILEHEKVHASQWHTIDVLLTQITLAIQWANPLAWLYKESLEQNLEFIADSKAARIAASSTAYQRTLVKVSSTALRPALTNNFYHSLIKKRIVMLNKEASQRRNLWKLGLVLPMLTLFMYSFNVNEVVEYREVSSLSENTEDSAFAKADIAAKTSLDRGFETPSFTISNTTSDQDLANIERYFLDNFESTRVKFTKINHINGVLKGFDFSTKMGKQNRYVTRFSVSASNTPIVYTIIPISENKINVQQGETKMIVTDEELSTTFSIRKDAQQLGENPILVVNGKVVSQSAKKINFSSADAVKTLMPANAMAKYGSIARDGAFVIEDPDNTTMVNGKYLKQPKITTSQEKMGKNPAVIVNGKIVSVPPNISFQNIALSADVHTILPSKAVALYGIEARDGAFVIENLNLTAQFNIENLQKSKSFVINDKTTDQQLRAMEKYFATKHPKTVIEIYNVKRNASADLISYDVRTKFATQYNWNQVLGVHNAASVSQGIQVSAGQNSDGPTIDLQELGPKGILMRSTPSRLLVEDKNLGKGLMAMSEGFEALAKDLNTTKEKAQQSFRVKITKNTTIEELRAMKASLKKEHNVDFDFSNVDFNENYEIIGISISYNSPNDNSGNYNVHGSNGIADFYFYMEADGRIGIGNDKSSTETRERMAKRRSQLAERSDERQKEIENRMEKRQKELNVRSEERKQELEARSELRKEEMESRREEMRARIKAEKELIRQKEVFQPNSAHVATGYVEIDNGTYYYATKKNGETSYYNRFGERIQSDNDIYEQLLKAEKRSSETMKTRGRSAKFRNLNNQERSNVSGSSLFIVANNAGVQANANDGITVLSISKDTSDKELKTMRSDLEAMDVYLQYSRIKRNNTGEITGISLKLKKDGNKSSSSFSSNNPIQTIWLGFPAK
jgi:hypothetical protein